uniref:NADH-ubiquinone oxidoreductase chain 6 n=1 Tax=Epiphragma mediale TaxID=2804209 RepID=A0A7U0IT88_9DIPT|nr:NADH dehydrogenase subunit 6 [Epiphragma mediale]QQV67806.1 NADH dehydrogenase subunit 6 [Epiphragma mediale]
MLQYIITCSFIISILFLMTKHPLAMGITLLAQTFLMCLISSSLSKTSWFSYILFLIFLGGMLVLFIYVTALASNEMFSLSMSLALFSISFISISLMIMFLTDSMILSNFLNNMEMNSLSTIMNFMEEDIINLNKLYNFPTNMMTLLLINYLFLTLIVVVKITENSTGPLRNMN